MSVQVFRDGVNDKLEAALQKFPNKVAPLRDGLLAVADAMHDLPVLTGAEKENFHQDFLKVAAALSARLTG